jgi:hypothetical protein
VRIDFDAARSCCITGRCTIDEPVGDRSENGINPGCTRAHNLLECVDVRVNCHSRVSCSAKYYVYQPPVPSITEVLAAAAASDCPGSTCSQ